MTNAPTTPILPTIADILAAIPEKDRPYVAALGPGLLAMAQQGLDNVANWILRIAAGDLTGAYRQVVGLLPEDSFLKQWDTDDALLDLHNAANADNVAVWNRAIALVLQGMLGAAAMLVAL